MNWDYEGKEVESLADLPSGVTGFVYQISYQDGSYYYGKRDIYSKTTLPALKNNKQRPNSERVGKNKDGKRVYFDIVTKENGWLDYEGSSELTVGLVIEAKHIIAVSYSKRNLTYLEAKVLFAYEALEDEDCLNQNILGRFFKGNLN